jgi:hypothetical protein
MGQAWATDSRPDDKSPLVVRPKIPWLDYATVGVILGVCFGFTALTYLVIASINPVWASEQTLAVAMFLGIVALFLSGLLRLYLVSRIASLRVERHELVWRNGLGLPRRLNSERVARIYEASFYLTTDWPYVMTYVLFLDPNGRTLFKLPAKWWPHEGMEAVGSALGVPVNGAVGVLRGPAFRSAFPGSISWVVAHPVLACCVVTPLIGAAFIAVLAVVSLLQGPS